jgi:hypothetical protein
VGDSVQPHRRRHIIIENLRGWFTYELARYKLNHALDEEGELDEKKLKMPQRSSKRRRRYTAKLKHWENYLTARSFALRARVLAARSWEELLKRSAKGFCSCGRRRETARTNRRVFNGG